METRLSLPWESCRLFLGEGRDSLPSSADAQLVESLSESSWWRKERRALPVKYARPLGCGSPSLLVDAGERARPAATSGPSVEGATEGCAWLQSRLDGPTQARRSRPRNPGLPRSGERDGGDWLARRLSGGSWESGGGGCLLRDPTPGRGAAALSVQDFPGVSPAAGAAALARRARGGALHMPRGLLRQLGGAALSLSFPKGEGPSFPGTAAQPFPLRPSLSLFDFSRRGSAVPPLLRPLTRRLPSVGRAGRRSMQPGDPDENDALQGRAAADQPCSFPMAVYEPRPLHSQAPLFLKGVPIVARVESTERYTWGSKVRPSTVYALQLSHGPFTWSMKKLFRHFQELHRDLTKHRLLLSLLPLPRLVLQGSWPVGNSLELPSLPHGGGEVSRRPSSKQKQLESYLNALLEMSAYRDYHAMTEFLDVSRLSFLPDLGPKGLEGLILKRSGGHRIQGLNCMGHHQVCYRWSKRWLVVKEAFLLYLKPESGVISCVLLFDPAFSVQVGKKPTETKYGVRVDNSCRSLVLKCSSYRQARWWGQQIAELASGKGHEHLRRHRHEGFAPVRQESPARWFLNGAGYFAAVADALLQAREEIFITDWWLSPEVYMKRPAQSDEWRLDLILKHKAEEGVRVCVLLFKEVELALGLNSGYSKRTLMLLHPNIKVMRHPDHVSSIVFLWAHHEKLVAVDQAVAFLGGLDLAYGRWDTPEYRLTDLEGENGHGAKGGGAGPSHEAPVDLATNQLLWLGKDYGNLIAKDWVHLDRPFEDFINRFQTPRMPWRDVGVAVHGVAARDVARHFIQRWNFTKTIKAKYKGSEYPYLLPKSPHVPPQFSFLVPGAQVANVQVLRSVDRWSAGLHECSIYNAYLDVIRNSQHYLYIENQFFISCTDGRSVLNTVGDAVVQRILLAHSEKKPFRVYVLLPLLPGFEGDIAQGGSNSIQAILHFTYRTLCRGESSIVSRLQARMGEAWRNYISFCGLRTHGELQGTLLTELVYVHSKMLIADDRRVIIGSANINDRSLLGKRDSELAVLVEDSELVPSVMGGQDFEAGKFALSLRLECFRSILGVAAEDDDVDIQDPISDRFFHDLWGARALANTSIYEEVFCCLPSDAVRSHRALREHVAVGSLASLNPKQARDRLQALRGLLVAFPLGFLAEEHLLPPLNCKEGMIPTEVWT